jgi:drug/metabolite transporter (DMT)-like permease
MLLKGASEDVSKIATSLNFISLPKLGFDLLSQPKIFFGVGLQGLGFIIWIFVLSRESAGVALGLGGACVYLLTSFFEWLIYGTRLQGIQYLGLFMVSVGALFISSLKPN